MMQSRRLESHLGITRREFVLGAAGLGVSGGSLGSTASETPKRGGNLRVAILGGGSADSIDANYNLSQPDAARVLCLYQPLRRVRHGNRFDNLLAESMESNRDATEWTIRLRQDVTFHNGKTLSAEDVAYTFRRVTDPTFPLIGAPELGPMDRNGIRILDERTLRIPMHAPFSIFDQAVADDINLGIVPVDYDPKRPVGTGPFRFESFAPGQQSEFLRYDGFWGQHAFVDRLTLIDSFGSDTAAYNALEGGEVDAFAAAPLTLARLVSSRGSLRLNVSEATQWTPLCMRVDLPPFDNPDVRQAFRLIVDREQMIKIALSGYGVVGNDVCARWDGASEIFHRSRDIERAKALLKKAGHENLTVELTTADIANGVVQAAQIFARQAMDAGVTVKVRQVMPDVFFGQQFLTWPFTQDFWTLKSYLGQVELCLLPNSQYNETHWREPAYVDLYNTALATVDPAKRVEVIREMQTVDFERGGYIIPSHNQIVDLVSQNVRGLTPGTFFAMGDYDFSKLWLN